MSRKLTKRQKKKINKIVLANWKIVLTVLLLLIALFVVAYYMGWIDIIINKFKDEDEVVLSTAGGYETEVSEFKDLSINFLDVGQADCIIIQLPDGKNMIIDSGDDNSDRNVISTFATENNIDTFHYLLLTHQDLDHVANMDWVLENYKVNYIFRPNNYSSHDLASSLPETFNPVIDHEDAYVSTTKAYAEFMVAAYNEKCTVEIFNKDSDFTNYMINGTEKKSYTFDFLTPTAKRENIMYSEPNDYSPIFVLEYSGRKIMFNGDAEQEALEEYLDYYSGSYKNIDVLKVGHHGSYNASSVEFLSAVDPEYAVIMCGYKNEHKHPHQQVLDMLNSHGGVEIYRTDTNGTIVLDIDVDGKMNWDFDNDDMTYNNICGENMPDNLSFYNNRSNQVYETLVNMWKECVFEERRIII